MESTEYINLSSNTLATSPPAGLVRTVSARLHLYESRTVKSLHLLLVKLPLLYSFTLSVARRERGRHIQRMNLALYKKETVSLVEGGHS